MGARAARAEAFGYGRRLESNRVFLAAQSLAHQEAVGGDAQACVMMKATPVTPLVMMQSQLGLQLLIVALNASAPLRGGDECFDGRVGGKPREPVMPWLGIAQPFGRPFAPGDTAKLLSPSMAST